MKNHILFAFSVAALAACGSGNNTGTDMGTTPDPVKPAMASTQIERMGRPTINVAVTNPFDLDYSAVGGGTSRDQTRDMHSKDGNVQGWVAKWKPIHAKTLALYDGVDTKCGNQLGACGAFGGCPAAGYTPAATDYDTLAGVLADDQLYVNTGKTDCSFYLGVEASVLKIPGTDAFCGGRTPLADVVDITYTAAVTGVSGFPVPPASAFAITDGVLKDNEGTDSLTVFPFLSDPN